ncbi:hypothetical protein ZOSMA_55G00210 [Zostera marina]|uniref:Uncharacterized protein n=1 Tax=Zostera marina TaxID=29655 RepID=A0A0K9NW14_ZOSMR|nr:hypothetical protein ZOSMA_55G00210 [Zostera marina]
MYILKSVDRLKSALTRASQDYDQWISQQTLSCSPISPGTYFSQTEVSPTSSPANSFFGHAPNTTFGLKVGKWFIFLVNVF